MTTTQEREYHVAHPYEKRPNKFDKDSIKVGNKDYYSKWRSVDAQIDYKLAEEERIAREAEREKRAAKKKGVVNG